MYEEQFVSEESEESQRNNSLYALLKKRAELGAMCTGYRGEHYPDYVAISTEIQNRSRAYSRQATYQPQYMGAKTFIFPCDGKPGRWKERPQI